MSSYSPMPNQFFREFCQPDLNTNPIYGLIHKAIDSDTRVNFLEEIEEHFKKYNQVLKASDKLMLGDYR